MNGLIHNFNYSVSQMCEWEECAADKAMSDCKTPNKNTSNNNNNENMKWVMILSRERNTSNNHHRSDVHWPHIFGWINPWHRYIYTQHNNKTVSAYISILLHSRTYLDWLFSVIFIYAVRNAHNKIHCALGIYIL